MTKRLSLVIPVKNEKENVIPLANEIFRVMEREGHIHEVIFVDDGSIDGTVEKLCAMRQETKFLRVVRHTNCCGQSTALLSGIRSARYPTIVTLDGDGQNDPEDIPLLLETLGVLQQQSPVAMVVGYRNRRQDTAARRWSSKLANDVRSRLLKDQTPDTGCGLKAFSRETFLSLPYFNHMHRFLPALVWRMGGQVTSVEINHRPRTHGNSKYGNLDRLRVGIVDLLGVLWLQKRSKIPLVSEVD